MKQKKKEISLDERKNVIKEKEKEKNEEESNKEECEDSYSHVPGYIKEIIKVTVL